MRVDQQIGLEATPDAYVAEMVAVFHEVRRVLRDDGTLWLNLGDSYVGGRPGQQGLDGEMADREVAKHRSFSSSAKRGEGLKPKDLAGIPWMVAFALRADGWYLRSDIIWHKPNPMPESVTDRPTKAHEYLFLLAKSPRYFYDADAIAEASVSKCASGNGFVRPERLSLNADGTARGNKDKWTPPANGKRNARSVWSINTRPCKEAHFATMPEALVSPCIMAGSRPGDLVLDPFFGSGTVGRVAEKLGRQWLGFDLSNDYAEIAARRTAQRSLPGVNE